MDSTSVSGSEQKHIEYTVKQQKLISECVLALSNTGISLVINPKDINLFRGRDVALDVEHDELGGFVGCGFYMGSNNCYYFSDLSLLLSLDLSDIRIIAHNGVSDLECLNMWGLNVRDEQLVHDTMLVGHILDSSLRSYDLKSMAKRELNIEYPSYDDIVGKRGLKAERITLDKQPMELVSIYNAMDCIVTWKLYEKQRKALNLDTL